MIGYVNLQIASVVVLAFAVIMYLCSYMISAKPTVRAPFRIKEYLNIKCWQDKIASILKIAYLNEFIQNAYQGSQNINWKESFEYYIKRYGKDEELKKIATEMGLENILKSIPQEGNPQGYLSVSLAESLLCINEQSLN